MIPLVYVLSNLAVAIYVLQAIERLCHPDLTELVDTEEDELLVPSDTTTSM